MEILRFRPQYPVSLLKSWESCFNKRVTSKANNFEETDVSTKVLRS